MAIPVVAAAAAAAVADNWWTNRQATHRAHEQMDFASSQFATRYQTQVRDLKAAGLNPMLAYGQSPGSAPQGTAAPVQKGDYGNIAIQSRLASAQEAKTNQDTKVAQAQEENIQLDSMIKKGMPAQVAAQTQMLLKNAEAADTQIAINKKTLDKLHEEIKNLQKTGKQIDKITQLKQKEIAVTMQQEILVGQQALRQSKENTILSAKEKAAQRWSAEAGENAQNMWKIVNPFHNFMGK